MDTIVITIISVEEIKTKVGIIEDEVNIRLLNFTTSMEKKINNFIIIDADLDSRIVDITTEMESKSNEIKGQGGKV